jgi:cell pole-organizing protein PopZ
MRMAKPNQVPESSMEEILASIRKIISEDEAKLPTPKLEASLVRPPTRPSVRPSNNVSPLFTEEPVLRGPFQANDPLPGAEAEEREPIAEKADDWSHLHRPYRRLDIVAEPRPEEAAPTVSAIRKESASLPSAPLLSARADAAVASAFNHLASSILSSNSHSVEQMAEEMMRPMLKAWLDENLPPLVERLVREEIERVSRQR